MTVAEQEKGAYGSLIGRQIDGNLAFTAMQSAINGVAIGYNVMVALIFGRRIFAETEDKTAG